MSKSGMQVPNSHFNLLFENAPLPYQSLDEQGRFLDVNKRWLKTLGYRDKSEILGTRFRDYLAPDSRKIFEERFSLFKISTSVDEIDFDIIRRNGTIINVSLSGQIQKNDKGDFVCTHCIFHNVTEVKNKTRALRESENRYRRLSDVTFESIFITEKGICLELNSTAERMFGYTPEEAVGRHATDFVDPKDRDRIMRNILSGYEEPYEVTAVRKDGTGFPCEIQGRTIKHEGKTLRISALRDISSRKTAEKELRNSERRYRLIFEHSPMGLAKYNSEGQIIDCNRKFIDLMGSSREKLIGFNVIKDCSPEISQALNRAVNGQIFEYEGLYTSVTGGKTSYFRAIFNPVNPHNPPTEVIASAEDITDRKEVEKKLAANEKRFRLLAENAQDIIYRFSIPDKEFLYMSPASEKLTGYPPDRFYKDANFFFGITHPAWKGFMNKQWHAMVRGTIAPVIEYRIIHRSGDVKWLQQSSFVIYDESGIPQTVEGIVRDVTELKTTLKDLEREKARAEAASKAKSDFLANMSHEIRTPLNGIMGMLQLMQDKSPSQRQQEYIRFAMQASKRLHTLLADILDLTQVEAGKLVIRDNEFIPGEILQQTYDMFKAHSMQNGLRFELKVSDDFPAMLIGDALRLQQILSNLVGNALKFTDRGMVTLEAMKLPYSTADRDTLLFIVSDTGRGIPESMMHNLFESFTQISNGYTRRHQGVGLGLAICKKLAQLMEGNISVESEEGRGSTFYLSIPFKKIMQEKVTDSTAHDLIQEISPLSGFKVLVAEDEKINRLYTRKFLELEGCEVETVENGQQVLEKMTYEDFNLVVMDVQMPVMNGLETTEAIRRGEAGAHNKRIPIIAVTAYAMAEDREKFILAGMNDCITKPVEQLKLQQIIRRMLNLPV